MNIIILKKFWMIFFLFLQITSFIFGMENNLFTRIAISPIFTNRTGLDKFDYLETAIPSRLVSILYNQRELDPWTSIIPLSVLDDVLRVLNIQEKNFGLLDEKTLVTICKMKGANHIVIGSFTKDIKQFYLTANLININDFSISSSAEIECNINEPFSKLSELAFELLKVKSQDLIYQHVHKENIKIITALYSLDGFVFFPHFSFLFGNSEGPNNFNDIALNYVIPFSISPESHFYNNYIKFDLAKKDYPTAFPNTRISPSWEKYKIHLADTCWKDSTCTISGLVTDTSNIALPYSKITLYDYFTSQFASSVETNFKGEYLFNNLLPGSYKIVVDKNNYTSLFYPKWAKNTKESYQINLSPGDSTIINFKLEPGGSISGAVLNKNNEGITDFWILTYSLDKEGWIEPPFSKYDGFRYIVSGLSPGYYIIMVVSPTHAGEYYQDKYNNYIPIEVKSNETTKNIDFYLQKVSLNNKGFELNFRGNYFLPHINNQLFNNTKYSYEYELNFGIKNYSIPGITTIILTGISGKSFYDSYSINNIKDFNSIYYYSLNLKFRLVINSIFTSYYEIPRYHYIGSWSFPKIDLLYRWIPQKQFKFINEMTNYNYIGNSSLLCINIESNYCIKRFSFSFIFHF